MVKLTKVRLLVVLRMINTDPKTQYIDIIYTTSKDQNKGKTKNEVLRRGFICIPRSSNREQIRENTDVFDLVLSESDMITLNSL